MRDCPRKRENNDFVQIVVASYEDIYESVYALVISSLETKERERGHGLRFLLPHVSKKEYFETLKL